MGETSDTVQITVSGNYGGQKLRKIVNNENPALLVPLYGKFVDERIPYLLDVPTKHRWISLKPFIGEVYIDRYLAAGQIETVLAGGENY